MKKLLILLLVLFSLLFSAGCRNIVGDYDLSGTATLADNGGNVNCPTQLKITYQIGLGNHVIFTTRNGGKTEPFDVLAQENIHDITTPNQKFHFMIEDNIIGNDQLKMWKKGHKNQVCTYNYKG